jgi:hypothetical protein
MYKPYTLFGPLDPDEEGTKNLPNVGKYFPVETA